MRSKALGLPSGSHDLNIPGTDRGDFTKSTEQVVLFEHHEATALSTGSGYGRF